MDEEEQKRQAASAAFAQAAGYEDPNQAVADIRVRGAANAPVEGAGQYAGENMARIQDETARSANLLGDGLPEQQSYGVPGSDASYRQQFGQNAVPGASEAFAQLDQAQPSNPTQFDAASVAGLEPAQQQMVRENFDANLEAATRAVEEYAQGDDAFSRQAQRLLERAERARERQVEQVQQLDQRQFMKIKEPDYSQMAQPDRSRAIRENVRMGAQQRFIPLTTPEDYQASAMADLEMRNGRDPFEF